METIKERVTFVVAEHLGLNEAEVTPEKSFKELGGDSLDQIELVMWLEDEFGIEISDEDGDKILTTQQAIDYVTPRAKL